jgi:hypothetical protein
VPQILERILREATPTPAREAASSA